jgi:hypothetical protein
MCGLCGCDRFSTTELYAMDGKDGIIQATYAYARIGRNGPPESFLHLPLDRKEVGANVAGMGYANWRETDRQLRVPKSTI